MSTHTRTWEPHTPKLKAALCQSYRRGCSGGLRWCMQAVQTSATVEDVCPGPLKGSALFWDAGKGHSPPDAPATLQVIVRGRAAAHQALHQGPPRHLNRHTAFSTVLAHLRLAHFHVHSSGSKILKPGSSDGSPLHSLPSESPAPWHLGPRLTVWFQRACLCL